MNPDKFAAAFEYGLNDARALAIGDVFTGAFGAAKARGYESGTPEYKAFVSGYLYGLDESGKKDRILVDRTTYRVIGFAS